MTAPNRRRPGFTIIELLVVVSVIAVLLGFLLPALGGARRRGLKTDEMSQLRQVGTAWNLYAQANRDSALPGFLDDEPGPGGLHVQDAWRVRYSYANGEPVTPDDAEEWPWRLLQYVGYSNEIVLGHLDLDVTHPQAMSDPMFIDRDPTRQVNGNPLEIARPTRIAEEPSFAYNGFYVGGWYDEWLEIEDDDPETDPTFNARTRFSGGVKVLDKNGAPLTYENEDTGEVFDVTANPVARSPAAIRNSSNLILFCSASRMPLGEFHDVEDNRFGSHVVVPPYLADQSMWRKSTQTPSDSAIQVRGRLDDVEDAGVPIGRYTGTVASIRADLHVDATAPGTLDDQRLWIDSADRKLWIHSVGR